MLAGRTRVTVEPGNAVGVSELPADFALDLAGSDSVAAEATAGFEDLGFEELPSANGTVSTAIRMTVAIVEPMSA